MLRIIKVIKLISSLNGDLKTVKKETNAGFPGGTVAKSPPANAGDVGLSPGPGRSHMPWRN